MHAWPVRACVVSACMRGQCLHAWPVCACVVSACMRGQCVHAWPVCACVASALTWWAVLCGVAPSFTSLIHLPVDGYLNCALFMVIMSKAAMSITVGVSLGMCSLFILDKCLEISGCCG